MNRIFLSTLLISLSLISCKNTKEEKETKSDETQSSTELVSKEEAATTSKFDINKIPLSTYPIAEIPFFSLPSNYEFSRKFNSNYETIRFWTGEDFELPEGNLFYSRITPTEKNQFSVLELTKNLDKVISDAGGVQVFQGKVPNEAIQKNEEMYPITDYNLKTTAYGFQGYAKTWTYVIRQTKQNIWLQLNESDDNASLYISILKTKTLDLTAELIKADTMKQALDKKGMVTLYVNFDNNKSNIKQEALPTMDEIFKLLTSHPELKISIEGHTDNTGDKQYNMQLSDLRAKEILNYLTTKGIKANRLKSAGFGDKKPVAANDTEENKALNRRVELRKIE